MIFVYLISFAYAALIAFFVLRPLVGSGGGVLEKIPVGFADEQELRSTLFLRDALLTKLTTGKSENIQLEKFSEQDCYDSLIAICLRLQRAGLPYLPKFGALLAFLVFAFASQIGMAQDDKMQIPLAAENAQHEWMPRLHQFALLPGEASLHVRYVGYFRWEGADAKINVLLPLPDGVRELKIPEQKDALLSKGSQGTPVLEIPVKQGNVHVQAEFTLAALGGVAHFQNSTLGALPGTVLFFMPEYEGGLRNMLTTFVSDTNVWPARLVDMPADFQSTVAQDTYDPSEPNYKMLMRLPPQFTRRALRFGQDNSPYPTFEVNGLVPSRTGLYVLAGCFASFIFGFSVLANRLKKLT